MNASDIFASKLRSFYDREGIAVKKFECPHRDFCAQSASGGQLSHGSEAYVGPRYGEILKIVVISPDAGGGSSDLEERRAILAAMYPANQPPQLEGTEHLLRKLLAKEISGMSPFPYFAMIHAAKCSAADGSRKQMPDTIHKKCRPYAKTELLILEPDVIITQGDQGLHVLDQDFPEHGVDVTDLLAPANTVGNVPVFDWLTLDWLTTVAARYLTGIRVAERHVYALHTPHPSEEAWQSFEQLHLPICAWLIRELLARK